MKLVFKLSSFERFDCFSFNIRSILQLFVSLGLTSLSLICSELPDPTSSLIISFGQVLTLLHLSRLPTRWWEPISVTSTSVRGISYFVTASRALIQSCYSHGRILVLLLLRHLVEELIPCLSYRVWKLWGGYIVHSLVMHEHLRRKTFQDPDMPQSFIWCQPLLGIPFQTLLYKI